MIFPDFSAFQMTIDAVPVRPDRGGAAGTDRDDDAGTDRDDDAVRRLQRQDALGPDAWPGFTPAAARQP